MAANNLPTGKGAETPAPTQPQDMMQMFAAVLASNAALAELQRNSLAIEMARDAKIKASEDEREAKRQRDRKQILEQAALRIENERKAQAACASFGHKHPQSGDSAIYPISNWPDGRIRGTCLQCRAFIQPEHLEIGADGKNVLVPEDKFYQEVLRREFTLYSQFLPTTGY